MIVDLQEIRERGEPYRLQSHFSVDQLDGASGTARVPDGASFDLTLNVGESHVVASGSVTARLLLNCSRCLNEYPVEVDKTFRSEFVPDLEVSREGEELALTYSELDVGFYHNDQLDLTAVIGEQVFLEVPMKAVCVESCKGLCDQCGTDLNKDSCDCSRSAEDPRLEALRDLQKRMSQ